MELNGARRIKISLDLFRSSVPFFLHIFSDHYNSPPTRRKRKTRSTSHDLDFIQLGGFAYIALIIRKKKKGKESTEESKIPSCISTSIHLSRDRSVSLSILKIKNRNFLKFFLRIVRVFLFRIFEFCV